MFTLDDGFNVIPTAGFSYSQSKAATLNFAGGEVLQTQDEDTVIGFIGATLAKTVVLPDEVSARTNFATFTYYGDFSDDRTVFFTPSGGTTETITSESLGDFSELSIGTSYVRILDEGQVGAAKQLTLSVRGDARLSDRVDGIGITAQARLQF